MMLISEVTAISGADMASPFYTVACLIYEVGLNTMGALAALMFVYGGIKWIMSEDPETRLMARHIITWSIVGIILFSIIKGIISILIPDITDICPALP